MEEGAPIRGTFRADRTPGRVVCPVYKLGESISRRDHEGKALLDTLFPIVIGERRYIRRPL